MYILARVQGNEFFLSKNLHDQIKQEYDEIDFLDTSRTWILITKSH